MKRAHVIGAGMAGLSAALRLVKAGVAVTLYEVSPHAGGRCRSFIDPVLNAVIDNGAHLMLNGNREVHDYLRLCGGQDEIITAPRARFDFFDALNGQCWALDLGDGHGMWSLVRALMQAKNRPPGLSAWTLWKDLGALKYGGGKTVAACVGKSAALEVFWEPLTIAVLNAHPHDAAASLLWRVLTDTVLKGGEFARPLFTRQGLGAALVDPALSVLHVLDATVRLGTRVQGMEVSGDRVVSLDLGDGVQVLGTDDVVVLAVPHFAVHDFIAAVPAPTDSRAILNVHFQCPQSIDAPPMTGLVHSDAQWVFVRGNIASVTVSAADAWMDKDAAAIAADLWPDVARALNIAGDVPAYRVIKERRATFAQTPAALASRPSVQSPYENVVLAGDWTATDLPATIEGALKSGRLAAEAVIDG